MSHLTLEPQKRDSGLRRALHLCKPVPAKIKAGTGLLGVAKINKSLGSSFSLCPCLPLFFFFLSFFCLCLCFFCVFFVCCVLSLCSLFFLCSLLTPTPLPGFLPCAFFLICLISPFCPVPEVCLLWACFAVYLAIK